MRKILLTAFLFIGIFGLPGAISANAQNALNGRYIYKVKEGETTYSFTLKFEGKDAVYYSYEDNGYGTLKGTWSVENRIVRVFIPNEDLQLMFKFKPVGDDLEVIETLHHSIVDAGAVFKKDVSKPTGPDLTAEDTSNRVLKLIKSVHSLKDITPKNVERQMKIKVSFNEENRSEYGFGGNIIGATDWTYGVIAYPFPSKDNKTIDTLRFSFDYQLNEPISPDLSPVCKVDFDAFSKELTKAGFSTPTPVRGEHNMIIYWTSSRDKTSLNISADGENKNSKRSCVKMLTISITN